MDESLRRLFRELADAGREDRERIFAERGISPEARAEVESLLDYDATSDESVAQVVSGVADAVLRQSHGGPEFCGAYRLVRMLGIGGMGAVYLAERRDGEIEQRVAIKLLRADADRPAWRERFLRERQFLASLNHPAIAKLLDAGHTGDGRPYLVMEYVDGVAIDVYAQPLDLPSKLQLFLQVCEGVSDAHRHLIVHRDLKPSNILVDSSGRAKLLDFGIAKLIDVALEETQTIDRVLTPSYASPEQMRGEFQTTATDIYSLGAVLHKLVHGRPPREQSRAPEVTAGTHPDVDCILGKALQHEPSERYPSVDALADDIRAFLEMRPVKARSAGHLYRAWKFLRRHRVAAGATAITVLSLLAGVLIANQQRRVAERRLEQVRQLTTRVLQFDRVISGQQSSTSAKQEIVAMSRKSLEVLAAEARTDQSLALEVGEAYSHLARVQGISVDAGPAGHAQAEESLSKAYHLVAPILSADPAGRRAQWVAARIAHDRMILAASRLRNSECFEQARAAGKHLEQLLTLGELSESEGETASELYYNIALTEKNLYQLTDAVRHAGRSVEVARRFPGAQLRLSLGQSLLADLLRLDGNLEGALAAIRDARNNLGRARFPSETARRSAWFTVYLREGKILGSASGLSLNRTAEAASVLQKAFSLVEEWTQSDAEDAWSRLFFAVVGRELGEMLGLLGDPRGSLRVYDHSLARLREVKDNQEALRGEAEILGASAAALRRLNGATEAKRRIDLAIRMLRQTGDYPAAERVAPDNAVYVAIRALAEHHAATGRWQDAAAAYEDLLARVTASAIGPRRDLRHAFALSEIYGALASLHSRDGQRDRGEAAKRLRLELWREWEGKLPNNELIRRQLDLARQP